MITCPGITHCSKCYKPLETGELAICKECESEEKKLSEKIKVCDGSMIEEEKKAIEVLKNMNDGYTFKDCEICDGYNEKTCKCDIQRKKCDNLKAIETILNLVEKLKKENEELKKQKVEYLDKIYNKIDNLKYEYKKAAMHSDPERASFYRDLIRHFKILLEEEQ